MADYLCVISVVSAHRKGAIYIKEKVKGDKVVYKGPEMAFGVHITTSTSERIHMY